MSKIIYKCKVDGVVGRQGRYTAICGKIKFGNDSVCGAHGNTKCTHKVKEQAK